LFFFSFPGTILLCALAADKHRSLTQCISLYKQVSSKVFNRTSTMDILSGTSRLMWAHAYYDTSLWEELLQKHMGYSRMIDTSKSGHVPKFCCVSTTISERQIEGHVFRNYVLPCNVQSVYAGSNTARLWEVVRASSAAPAYFGDFLLQNKMHLDGGTLFNNPTAVAIHEAKLLWPNDPIQCVVSIGTGRPPNKAHPDGQKLYNAQLDDDHEISSWKTKFLRILDSATDTEATHIALSDLLPPGRYFRFNPYLTEWIPMVEVKAEKYALLERDALLYYRKNEEKFDLAAAHLTEKRSIARQLLDEFREYMRY
jgi:calcium-independent phospholipase A2-gamma